MRYVVRSLLTIATVSGLCAGSATAAVPHTSFHQASIGNGYGFGVVDGVSGRLVTLTEAPYAFRSAGVASRDVVYDAYFGVRSGGEGSWLGEVPVDTMRYVDQAGIVETTQHVGALTTRTYAFSPFGLEAPCVVLALSVTNDSGVAQNDAAAYSLFNLHLGSGAPEPGSAGEHVTYDAAHDTFSETGPSGLTARYLALGASRHHGASPKNPYSIVKAGGELVDVTDSGVVDDAVAGFEWSLSKLAPGETRWVGVVLTLGDDTAARTYVAGRSADKLVTDERAAWEAWRVKPPAGTNADELAVWRQSEAILRMAQTRMAAPAKGQIVAAMPPGIWWITWARDMSYATAALARAGHKAEADAAIDFFAGAKVGGYKSYVGTDYHVSVVRYFGDGTEESDSNADGPNVEFDGFGLATWAAHAAGRKDLDANADTLRALVDPANGLLKADSSIWEVHWNGKQKHYTYTSLAAARGLCDAGDAKSALSIRDAILKNLVLPTGGLAQSLEELAAAGKDGNGARDAAVIEAIAWGLVNPLGERAQKLIADLEPLRAPTGFGYFRNDDGGGYDSQEWAFIDLRVATALHRMGRKREAAKLLGWITAQAVQNYDLVPELFTRETADYAGAIPMVGFGAGAYMHALLDRADASLVGATDPCFPKEGPDVTTIEPDPDAGPTPTDAGAETSIDDAASDAGADAAMTDTSASDTASAPPGQDSKSGCSCTMKTETHSNRWWLAALGLGAVWLRRKRDRTSAKAGAALLLASSLSWSIGCANENPKDEPSTPDADAGPGDVVLVDTALDGLDSSSPPDGASDTPIVDAPPPPPGTIPLRDCQTSFRFPLGRAGAKVELIGEWDGFAKKTAMTDGLGTGTYRAELTIAAGSYGYKFVVDGTDYRFDPGTRYTRYVAGTENSRVDVGDCQSPLLTVVSAEAKPDGTLDVEVQYTDGASAKGPDLASLVAQLAGAKVATTFDAKSGRLHLHQTGLSKNKYTYTFDAKDSAGKSALPLIVPMWVELEPFRWEDGPLYFVFTDRFRDGDPTNDAPLASVDARANYQGGDYKGVLAAIEDGYFDALGVRSIWLSPPNDNTGKSGIGTGGHQYSGYHGYWPTGARKVEEHWGTLADLRAVTAAAHKHGIRVILDLVQNQLHEEHEYYLAHKKDGWFNGDGSCVCGGPSCDWDTHATDCWFTSYLPDINWTNMGAVDQMTDDALWWLSNADADGFRVDAVKHMQDIASTTLRIKIRNQLETGNARYWLVGETFTGTDGRPLINRYVGNEALWGQFDFPLYWTIDSVFAANAGTMSDLESAVAAGEAGYVPGAVMSPFLGNHDVTRFLSRAAGQIASDTTTQAWSAPPTAPSTDEPYDRLFLAFTFLLTQKGVPLIYDGDEIGQPGTADPDNRRMMRFAGALSAREQKLLDRVKIVAKARGTLPGLRRGARKSLYLDGDGYVFSRGASIDAVIVALNRGTTSRVVHVALDPSLGIADGTILKDLLGGPAVTVTAGAIDVPFTPRGASLYTL